MATPTPQFKIKCSHKQREFARVLYANFSEACILAKHKTPHTWGKASNEKVAIRCEDITFVGREESSEDVFVSNHWNQFQPV